MGGRGKRLPQLFQLTVERGEPEGKGRPMLELSLVVERLLLPLSFPGQPQGHRGTADGDARETFGRVTVLVIISVNSGALCVKWKCFSFP